MVADKPPLSFDTNHQFRTLSRGLDPRRLGRADPGGRTDHTGSPAEIYRQVERLPEVRESVCVGQRHQGDVRVILFVVLDGEWTLDDGLRDRIRRTLREHASPRHVPHKILQVDDIPRTHSCKISELAVRDCVEGRVVNNTAALRNPEAFKQYRNNRGQTQAVRQRCCDLRPKREKVP